MHNRSSIKKFRKKSEKKTSDRDVNEIAVKLVTDETVKKNTSDGKNAAAVALGRLGGLKGGKARAAKLSAEERSSIAKKAANARWKTDKL